MRFHLRHRWLTPWLVASAAAFAVEAEPPVAPGSPYTPPLPALARFAAAEKIPLEQINLATDGTTEPRPGDSVTALVTLYEGERYRQWLIQLTTVKLTPAEQREIEKSKSKLTIEMFTSVGTELRINSAP
jgi:hypothetical protein